MQNKVIKYVLCLLMAISASSYAQQDSQYTQYMYNTISVNPAYTASRKTVSAFGMYRTQWVSLDGAPTTGLFSIEYPVSEKVGLGLTFLNDRIGISDESTLSVDFSYTMPVSDDYYLAFGLKGTLNLLTVEYSKLNLTGPDVIFQNDILNRFSPNIGTGFYLYSEKFYAGFSLPNMLETTHYNDNDVESLASEKLHAYFISGYVFDLTDDILLKPTLLTKAVSGAPLQVDFSVNALFSEQFTVGVAYRWSAALSGLVGFQVDKNWFIGYAYDAETTQLANYNSGSHEIFLRYEYEIFKKSQKVFSPRFF